MWVSYRSIGDEGILEGASAVAFDFSKRKWGDYANLSCKCYYRGFLIVEGYYQ